VRIIKAKDYHDMSRKAANFLSAQVILKPASVLGLATGSTPLGTYEQLAEWYRKGDVDFSETVTINLDEYCGLGPDDPQSYRHFMNENFFSKINIRPENTFLPNGLETDVKKECARYERLIRKYKGIDMQLLGVGHNGHIGFNEPETAFEIATHQVALSESTIQANKRFFEDESMVPRHAYTMGIRTIMQAGAILVIASGESKAEILRKSFYGPVTPFVPASVLQLHNNVILVVDEGAASRL